MGMADVAKAFADYMEQGRRDYALIGGFALYAYGYVRALCEKYGLEKFYEEITGGSSAQV